MDSLADFYRNGVAQSVLSSTPASVHVGDVKTPKMHWDCRAKGKVWVGDNGMIIENVSSFTHGIHIRKFYLYESQGALDSGSPMGEAPNLGKAKLLADAHIDAAGI